MNRLSTFTTAAAVALLGAAPLQAQNSTSAIGQWAIEWELGRRVQDADVQVIKATGTLTVKTDGDSLVATIAVKSRSDGAPLPSTLTLGGRASATGAVLSQVQQMRMNVNGEETVHNAKVTWALTVHGETLHGEVTRQMPMMIEGAGAPSAVTGKRITS